VLDLYSVPFVQHGSVAKKQSRLRLCWVRQEIDIRRSIVPISSHYGPDPASEQERAYLESLIREDFERCHPGETLEDLNASFLFEGGQGTVARLEAVAARRAAAEQSNGTGQATAA
jgi:hypothetical protein